MDLLFSQLGGILTNGTFDLGLIEVKMVLLEMCLDFSGSCFL
jgi:hypothetical protein